jgi:alpha-beta hydrolase superfamily lysophospholipase
MSTASALRFRLLLGLAKHLIFAVDRIPFPITLLYRQTVQPRLYLSVPEVGAAVQFPAGAHLLAGWFVAPTVPVQTAILLFHGIGDRLVYWRRAQQRLARSGIASLVFHYSGYPGSSGSTTPDHLANDALAAYGSLRERIPAGTLVFLLGFSLGSGLATEVAADLQPPPAGLILCEAFSTLRQAARRIARPAGFLANLLPDVWKSCQTVRNLPIPLLIVHSTGDALFPVSMAEEIHRAAEASGVRVELRVLEGHRHNAPYLTVPEDYWAEIVRFIQAVASTSIPRM